MKEDRWGDDVTYEKKESRGSLLSRESKKGSIPPASKARLPGSTVTAAPPCSLSAKKETTALARRGQGTDGSTHSLTRTPHNWSSKSSFVKRRQRNI